MARPRKVNPDTVALAKREYARMVDNEERDKNGFYIMSYTPQLIDEKSEELTSSIETLEDKLRRYKEQKKHYDDMKETPEYKTAKKKKKKDVKKRQNLLEAVFNNADKTLLQSEEESDDDHYQDTPKAKRRAAAKARKEKKTETTLETTYGTRYAPLVSMLYDMAQEFDDAAETIQDELNSKQGSSRGMYRSAQMGNYLTAKKQKFDVVKELVSVANKVTDIEYKKEKDNKSEESDTTRAITYLGAQFLRGTDRDTKNKMKLSVESGGPKKKKDKGKKKKDSKKSSAVEVVDDDDEGEVSSYTISESDAPNTDRKTADKFIKSLLDRRNDIKLDAHEYHIQMEGKYKFVVVADSDNPDSDWEFVAVDPETDKKLKGFKEQYKELYPKKKMCRMRFDLERGCAIDKNSNKKYPLKLK